MRLLALLRAATLVITESGGVQEETTYLGVPCATVRSAERPVTVTAGTKGFCRWAELDAAFDDVDVGRWPRVGPPPLWGGHTAARVADSIERWSASVPSAP